VTSSGSRPELFVPAFPTIRPESAVWPRGGGVTQHFPFTSPSARYFYFARNAIWSAVKTLGLDRGEILVPSYHHGVEIEALLDAGARVDFYRIGPRFEVDLEDVERRITPQTSALYLTHFLGFPGPVREMKALARKHSLPLIEDCALALFSADGDLPLGITGDIAIFCLYKVLAVPDGGVLVRNEDHALGTEAWPDANPLPSPSLASNGSVLASSILRNVALRGGRAGRRLRDLILAPGKRALRASGVKPVLAGTQHFNRDHSRLGPSQVTRWLLRAQNVPEIIAARRRNYEFLLDRLGDVSPPLFETLPAGVVPLCYPIVVDDNRAVMEALVARGIEAVDFWREGHPACDVSKFPDAARLRGSIVEIPCYQDLTLATLDRMADIIRRVLARRAPASIRAAA
jgi:dTDP-4-amino-4,6-dideoxygalactose transaminase